MTEEELLYYYPYSIDKQHNFRHFVNDHNAFQKRHIPNYDGTNTREFLYNKSGLSLDEIHNFEYLYENFSSWSNWYKNGRNMFSFSKDLLSMLDKTEVSDIRPEQFHLPYDIFYISLKPLNLKIASGRDEIIEGVFIDHNIWDGSGKHPEGYCELSLCFVGDFKDLFLSYIPHIVSRLPYTIESIEHYEEIAVGSFWRVWLWFGKDDGRETVKQAVGHFLEGIREEIFPKENEDRIATDFDLDFYNATTDLLENTINMVINCMLYLSQPTEKVDLVKEFPIGLPNNFDKKRRFAKTSKEQLKINQRIEDLGFTKINYVGRSFKEQHITSREGASLQPHWRRGHWRNQKYGSQLKESRVVWIMPTIVNSNIGTPLKGHIYHS